MTKQQLEPAAQRPGSKPAAASPGPRGPVTPEQVALELLELPEMPNSPRQLNNMVGGRIWRKDGEPMPWDDSRRRAWQFLRQRLEQERQRRKRIEAAA